ncbi:MAG TPA: DUF692 domain-containing protein [Terrimicrobiaceae bacterium]
MMIGVGYRNELHGWIAARPIECLEVTAEHFYGRNEAVLGELSGQFSLFVHGLGLSFGTPGELDHERLDRFARVVEIARPEWISEHIAFTRTAEVDLGHLNPVKPTRAVARTIAAHSRQVAERCGRPIILENITSHLRIEGELSETDFLNSVCEQADCGLLLDVTNLFINSRNHAFDPLAWLKEIPPGRIKQLHIVGYTIENGRYSDGHAQPIQDELIELARAVVEYAPVRAIILERDTNFPGAMAMEKELGKLAQICGRH